MFGRLCGQAQSLGVVALHTCARQIGVADLGHRVRVPFVCGFVEPAHRLLRADCHSSTMEISEAEKRLAGRKARARRALYPLERFLLILRHARAAIIEIAQLGLRQRVAVVSRAVIPLHCFRQVAWRSLALFVGFRHANYGFHVP